VHTIDVIGKIERVKRQMYKRLVVNPPPEELAAKLGMALEKVPERSRLLRSR
jgi:DNA-directed RNA polymerase sigma subunit (sigma70/sigma32)